MWIFLESNVTVRKDKICRHSIWLHYLEITRIYETIDTHFHILFIFVCKHRMGHNTCPSRDMDIVKPKIDVTKCAVRNCQSDITFTQYFYPFWYQNIVSGIFFTRYFWWGWNNSIFLLFSYPTFLLLFINFIVLHIHFSNSIIRKNAYIYYN